MSKEWAILPYIGLGPLRFGHSRSESRALLRGIPETFRKGPFAVNDTDAYDELGLHLYYDSEDYLRCISSFGSLLIRCDNVLLSNTSLPDVLQAFAGQGISSQYEEEGYWCHAFGFVLYAPETTIKAVTVFRRGYYEEEISLASRVRIVGSNPKES